MREKKRFGNLDFASSTSSFQRHLPHWYDIMDPKRFSHLVPQLCQVVRLVPGAYLEYKQALLNECRRQGGLRLAQARSLIKIDVNKTRKIYDFLIKEGYINKA